MPGLRSKNAQLAAALAAGIGLSGQALAAVPPHTSYTSLPFSNGFAAGVYDTAQRKLTTFLPHLYQAWDAETVTPDLLFDAYWGLRVDGQSVWLHTVAPSSVQYLPGTGIVRVIAHFGGVRVTTWWFAPMGLDAPAIATLAEVEVTDGAAHTVSLFTLENLHLGGTNEAPSPAAESAVWDADGGLYTEQGTQSGRVVHHVPLGQPAHRSVSPDNPYGLVTQGQDLPDRDASGVIDDVVAGFQFDSALTPGGSLWGGVLLAHGAESRDAALAWRSGGAPAELLQQELDAWAAWQQTTALPDDLPVALDAKRQALVEQSLAFLRMAQVREPNGPDGSPNGQILASMPPGIWNIAWVRDGAYSVVALARTGHHEEARRALDFMLNGKAGAYAAEVGHDYAISVCRYFGNGDEWSDGGETPAGPNIEYDNWGLLLWAARAYVEASGDMAWLSERWPVLADGVADVLVAIADPQTGLLPADSSIWEHHWNGNEKQFAYTQVTGARGLCDAAALATSVGDAARATQYGAAAHALRKGVLSEYAQGGGWLAGNLSESPEKSVDASAVEAFLMGIAPPAGPVAKATLQRFDEALSMKTGPGYKRNDDLDWYDRQEWVFIDLRVAIAKRLAGDAAKAESLLSWVVDQSTKNYGLIAELYEETTADYEGAVPMAGYGAGAYLLALITSESETFDACPAPLAPPADDPPDAGADAGADAGGDAGAQADAGTDATGADAEADAAEADVAGPDGGEPDAAAEEDAGPDAAADSAGDSATADAGDVGDAPGEDAAAPADTTQPGSAGGDDGGCRTPNAAPPGGLAAALALALYGLFRRRRLHDTRG